MRDGDVAALHRILTGLDRDSIEMPEVTPLSGPLSDEERTEVLQELDRCDATSWSMPSAPPVRSPARPRVIVVGSQAILGTYPEYELPSLATSSLEVDILPITDDNDETTTVVETSTTSSPPRVRTPTWRLANNVISTVARRASTSNSVDV
ncbi:MAG: hypothetical protein QOC63_2029 [Mycobacterium sp.]|nr:hypothetical protein [Mycobacterium sp.]